MHILQIALLPVKYVSRKYIILIETCQNSIYKRWMFTLRGMQVFFYLLNVYIIYSMIVFVIAVLTRIAILMVVKHLFNENIKEYLNDLKETKQTDLLVAGNSKAFVESIDIIPRKNQCIFDLSIAFFF